MINWELTKYSDLSKDLLYQILKIRQEVFVIEQNCNYLDADSEDQYSYHLIGFKNGIIVAYMRIVNPGRVYEYLSFGRILVKKEYRGLGLGYQLVQKALDLFSTKNPSIIMSAQLYLINFYKKFNFHPIGDEYLEDDIPHIKMIRNG